MKRRQFISLLGGACSRSGRVAVIAATGGGASILAAMAATKSIPIVFTTGGDPVKEG